MWETMPAQLVLGFLPPRIPASGQGVQSGQESRANETKTTVENMSSADKVPTTHFTHQTTVCCELRAH